MSNNKFQYSPWPNSPSSTGEPRGDGSKPLFRNKWPNEWNFKTLMCSWFFVDVNKLSEGIYQSVKPVLYDLDETIEKIILRAKEFKEYMGYTDKMIIELENNLQSCRLVDIKITINVK